MKRIDGIQAGPLERKALLDEVARMVQSGELRLGEAARVLRSAFLGMDRGAFARVTKVSVRTLANLEDDPSFNPTLQTLTRVFAPFGGKMALVFPRLSPPEPLSEESEKRREAIRTALSGSRRSKRKSE